MSKAPDEEMYFDVDSPDDAADGGLPDDDDPPGTGPGDYERLMRFLRKLRRYIAAFGSRTGGSGPYLYAVSLTHPQEWQVRDFYVRMAYRFVAKCAGSEGEGGWLMADVSPRRALHWYGLVLTSESPQWLVDTWSEASGAAKKAAQVRPVQWQNDVRSPECRVNLARVAFYAMKDLPDGIALDRAHRAVADGTLRDMWVSSFGQLLDPDFVIDVPELPTKANAPVADLEGDAGQKTDVSDVSAGRGEHTGEVQRPSIRPCARPGCPNFVPDNADSRQRDCSRRCKRKRLDTEKRNADRAGPK